MKELQAGMEVWTEKNFRNSRLSSRFSNSKEEHNLLTAPTESDLISVQLGYSVNAVLSIVTGQLWLHRKRCGTTVNVQDVLQERINVGTPTQTLNHTEHCPNTSPVSFSLTGLQSICGFLVAGKRNWLLSTIAPLSHSSDIPWGGVFLRIDRKGKQRRDQRRNGQLHVWFGAT